LLLLYTNAVLKGVLSELFEVFEAVITTTLSKNLAYVATLINSLDGQVVKG